MTKKEIRAEIKAKVKIGMSLWESKNKPPKLNIFNPKALIATFTWIHKRNKEKRRLKKSLKGIYK